MRKYSACRSLGLSTHPDEGAYTHFGPDMGMGLQGLRLPDLVATTNVTQVRDGLSIIPHYGQAAAELTPLEVEERTKDAYREVGLTLGTLALGVVGTLVAFNWWTNKAGT